MAAGKSTIAALLAKNLGYKHLDLDDYIQNKTGLKITEIFKTKGEVYFRKLESDILLEILAQKTPFVLAVGGGTPNFGNNMSLMNQKSLTVYLKVPQRELVNRLIAEKKQRPLVADLADDAIPEFVAKHLFERSQFYNQATMILDSNSKDVSDIVNEIELFAKAK